MDVSSNTVQRKANEAHDAVDAAAARASEKATPAIDRIARAAHQTVDRVAHVAAPTADWLGQSAEQWQQRQQQAVEGTRSYVRERPLAAIAVALAAGFLVGRWLR